MSAKKNISTLSSSIRVEALDSKNVKYRKLINNFYVSIYVQHR